MDGLLRGVLQLKVFRDGPLFDGTISDLANALYMDNVRRPDRYTSLIEDAGTGAMGYVQLKVRQFKSRPIEDYAAMVDDPEVWRALDVSMNLYFDDRINMFPFERRRYEDAMPSEQDGMSFENPEAFHIVQKDMIERRFASGEVTDVGESDLKETISSFRYVFVRNFWRLVLARRRVALEGIGMVIAIGSLFLAASAVVPAFWVIASSAFCALLAIGAVIALTSDRIQRHTDKFEDATRASCNVLSQVLGIRLHSLTEVIPQLIDRINHSKWDIDSTQLLEAWPLEVKKWSKLAFWLNARVEHIELMMQLQMWRIRRLHYGIRWVGHILTTVLTILAVASVGAISAAGFVMLTPHVLAAGSDGVWKGGAAVLLALTCLVSVFHLSQMTRRKKIPNLDLIRKTLATDGMRSFRDVRLHDKLADFVRREKKSQVYYEKMQGRV